MSVRDDLYRSALDSAGKRMEVTKYTEKLVPSTRFVAVDGVAPTVSEACFVAPSASVIGNVTIGQESRYVFFLFSFCTHVGENGFVFVIPIQNLLH